MMIWQSLVRTTFTLLFIFAMGAGQAEELGAIGDSISTAMDADDVCDDAVECIENLGEDWGYSFVTGVQSWSVRSRLLPFGFDGARTAAYNGAEWEDALAQAQELMAQTYAKYRDTRVHDLAYRGYSVPARLGISGTV